jgi:hypothetical protein
MWTRRMLVTSAKSFDLKLLLLDNRCLCRLIHKRISNLKLGWIILKEKEYFPLHINRLLMVCFVVQFWRMHFLNTLVFLTNYRYGNMLRVADIIKFNVADLVRVVQLYFLI